MIDGILYTIAVQIGMGLQDTVRMIQESPLRGSFAVGVLLGFIVWMAITNEREFKLERAAAPPAPPPAPPSAPLGAEEEQPVVIVKNSKQAREEKLLAWGLNK